MKTINKLGFYSEQDARDFAETLISLYGGYIANTPVVVNLSDFPTPKEIENWSGESNALCVFDEDSNVLAYLAYWV